MGESNWAQLDSLRGRLPANDLPGTSLRAFRDAHTGAIDRQLGVWRADGKPITVSEMFATGTWWLNAERDWVEIATIDYSYARTLRSFLERRAGYIHERVSWATCFEPGPTGDIASLAYEGEIAAMWDTDPLEWLRSTALYRNLSERCGDDLPHPPRLRPTNRRA